MRDAARPSGGTVAIAPAATDLVAQHAVWTPIRTDAPLEQGKLAHAVLHLRRGVDNPVTLAELIETHTRKIHLLIADGSLTNYHHEYPQAANTPGHYKFGFTPQKPGPYLAWANVGPTPLGLQEYEKMVIAENGKAEPLHTESLGSLPRWRGLHYELVLNSGKSKQANTSQANGRSAELKSKPDALAEISGLPAARYSLSRLCSNRRRRRARPVDKQLAFQKSSFFACTIPQFFP
jgi:hypothetical protein